MALGARECSLIAGLLLALERAPRCFRRKPGVNRHDGLLVSEEDPIASFPGQVAPGAIYVVAKTYQDVALILPSPCGRPCGDGTLTDGTGVIRYHRSLGHFIHATKAMAS